jgi:predicted RNA-binding Zn-ribbon protein involved in translation (DUF1610 family)
MRPLIFTDRVKQDTLREWILFCQDENTFRDKGDEFHIETVNDAVNFAHYLLEKESPSPELLTFYSMAKLVLNDFHPEHKLEECSYDLDTPKDVCPECGCEDIQGDSWEMECEEVWQPVSCNKCGYKWTEIYVYDRNEDGER